MQTPGTGSTRRRYLVAATAAALVGTALLTGGCGSSKSGGGTSTAPAPSPSAAHPELAPLAECLRQHGLTIPSPATAAGVRSAFDSLDAGQRSAVTQACRGLLPSGLAASLRARASATP